MDNAQLAARVQRLEDVAFEGRGLLEAVESLGQSAAQLADALKQVDRQHATLTSFNERLRGLQETVVPREEHERKAEELRDERRRTIKVLVAGIAFFVPFSAYGAIWMHELYRDACVPVVSGHPAPAWCHNVFPFDDDDNLPHDEH